MSAEKCRGIGHHAALLQQPAALARRMQQAMTAAAQANMARAPQLCACGYVHLRHLACSTISFRVAGSRAVSDGRGFQN